MAKKKNLDTLPVYEIFINDIGDLTGVRSISLVDDPAIEIKSFMFAKKKRWKTEGLTLPPVHPNCRCTLSDGVWKIEPDACEQCYEKRDAFKAGQRKANNRDKKDRTAHDAPRSSGFEKQMEFSADKEKMILAGPCLVPEFDIYRKDADGEYFVRFSAETIEMIVEKFFKNNNNRSINLDHTSKMVNGYIMSSWIVKDSYYDKSKYYGFDLPVGTWFVEIKIEDPVFWENEVKGLGKYGFSVEGLLGHKLMELQSECKCSHKHKLIDYSKEIDLMTDLEVMQFGQHILSVEDFDSLKSTVFDANHCFDLSLCKIEIDEDDEDGDEE